MNFNCPAYKGLLSAILRINWQQAALASILAREPSQAKPELAYKAPLRQRSIQLSAGQNVYEMTMPAQRRRAYPWCFSLSHNFYELHKYATLMVNGKCRTAEAKWKHMKVAAYIDRLLAAAWGTQSFFISSDTFFTSPVQVQNNLSRTDSWSLSDPTG